MSETRLVDMMKGYQEKVTQPGSYQNE